MTDKTLKDRSIDFKGKKYVEVKERVKYFNNTYPNGSITTIHLKNTDKEYFKAIVTPDCDRPSRIFTGHSQASFADTTSFVNKTSATENAETSAVGRALAFMGIGVIASIASMDEINKTTYPTKVVSENMVEPVNNLEVFCEVCKTKMVEKSGIKDGKEWTGYFCPKSTKEKPHAPRWV
jgi:hypothetical protein